MKKPCKQIRKSPHANPMEGKLKSGGAKYSTGSKGRAWPANHSKVVKKGGNPPGA